MRTIKISDGAEKNYGVKYVGNTLSGLIKEIGGEMRFSEDGTRAVLKISAPERYADYVTGEIEDRIADVIAVGYKYGYFRAGISASGLTPFEREILYSALIAADIDEDRRYVIKKARLVAEYAVDGIFNFRLTPLKRKWEEIVGYVPSAFTSGQLADFVRYLIGERRGKKAIIRNGMVYDGNYNLLERSALLPDLPCGAEGRILREVILSASGRVEVGSDIPEADRRYLRDFYGGRISFRAGAD